MKTILFALLMTISMVAYSVDCPPTVNNKTVCEVAEDYVDSLNESIPMKLYDGVTITGAEAVGWQIALTVKLGFTDQDMLILIIDSGATPAEVKKSMERGTTSLLCSTPDLRVFINDGGEVSYSYYLKDGNRFHHFVVREC